MPVAEARILIPLFTYKRIEINPTAGGLQPFLDADIFRVAIFFPPGTNNVRISPFGEMGSAEGWPVSNTSTGQTVLFKDFGGLVTLEWFLLDTFGFGTQVAYTVSYNPEVSGVSARF